MPDPNRAAGCQYKVGFLSLKHCENQAQNQCFMCNKQVCALHSRDLEGTKVCLECFAERSKTNPANEADEEAIRRGRIYRDRGYRTYYYDDDYYYYNRHKSHENDRQSEKSKDDVNPDDFQGS